ncbi:indole-3-glycerol phosphate synthase TrpC [Campylobacter vulpis]|uniref:indole-3-glycerol phosphate synthase TrpC n=1 Tax=Campylobacter vulpis TaxID=1655500 RepID=UPI001BCB171B|nr:indole-3-glycerol phosphate synthase TrpC [Campylobacter vulpis]MBS4235456.1 indole-3-glycerol phosphate synthase TrpC [Campylobacter vulpis]MBS4268962.1 indole-3-glycerol phosphate synthase TrpC [Campylobacter vulpis]
MILDEIFLKTKEELERRKITLPYDMLGRSLAANPFFPKDVRRALKRIDKEIKIIAEVKKASPSKRVLREEFEPLSIALNYEKNSAAALSILTEPFYFKGSLEYLSLIRRYTQIPLLRKDFIFDEYQILEALVYGADFVLLIAKMLSTKELKGLLEFSRHLGLEALVEIHNKEDLTKAILAGADIIGINHRNLDDFTMDMSLCEKLIPQIPNSKIIIAESGLENREFLQELQKIGVDAFLIGEYFMRQDDEGKALKALCED